MSVRALLYGICIGLSVLTAFAGVALAHAAEQGFVLLLPTDVYIAAGGASVALTVLLLAILPRRAGETVFRTVSLGLKPATTLRHAVSLVSTVILAFSVWQGFAGSRDPLSNPMPLLIWTVWWVGLVSMQGVIGNHWRWTNPWTGIASILLGLTRLRPVFRYPRWLGHWPGVVLFLCFVAFLLSDPAPADPARLASFVGLYWYLALLGLILFGPVWLVRGEPITILMRAYGLMGVIGRAKGRVSVGLWGWQVLSRPKPHLSLAVLMVMLLAAGSFDGLNETFWWMGQLGINPLEFPGRSAVVIQNLMGLLVSSLALLGVFTACLWLGDRLAEVDRSLSGAFRLFTPSILPIALGYHIAHYLTAFLVEAQYVVRLFNDPLATGSQLLGLSDFYVTTGFFNTPDTVRAIWLTQAGVLVVGHVVAILLAHAIAMRHTLSRRAAIVSQAPLAAFMIGYTIFGLWLLASPRGL